MRAKALLPQKDVPGESLDQPVPFLAVHLMHNFTLHNPPQVSLVNARGSGHRIQLHRPSLTPILLAKRLAYVDRIAYDSTSPGKGSLTHITSPLTEGLRSFKKSIATDHLDGRCSRSPVKNAL